MYGIAASRELISTITDVVADEITAWQSRPVDDVYPIMYVDAIRIRVKDRGVVTMKAAHLVVGVDSTWESGISRPSAEVRTGPAPRVGSRR